MQDAFVRALNRLGSERETVIAGFEAIKDKAFSVEGLAAEENMLTEQLNAISNMIQQTVNENARVAQDQDAYTERYNALVQQFETTKAKLEETQAETSKRTGQRLKMEAFIKDLKAMPDGVTEFDENLWCALCEYMTVYSKEDIRVTFRNGMEIKA